MGDSQVMISSSLMDPPHPTILRDIIMIELPGCKLETYLAIEWRLPVKAPSQWFDKHPILQALVWGIGFGCLEIVPISHLKGSYASCALDENASLFLWKELVALLPSHFHY